MSGPSVIVIGAGPSGIATGYNLKNKHGIENFTIYEKADIGGTWFLNSYPGCGCDVHSHLYSFSFNLNPNWSQELCNRQEILDYMNDTVDKFDLRKHIRVQVECLGASWDKENNQWNVSFRDLVTGIEFIRSATVLISAVGAISIPKDCTIPGYESFTGKIFHSARWDHSVDLKGKRVAVIGNGCSAVQLVPGILDEVKSVKQYARSTQWFHERPNHPYSSLQKWVFRNIPLVMRYYRLQLFRNTDNLLVTYQDGEKSDKVRQDIEEESLRYIYSKAPKRYHNMLTPNFPLGCKRRIFDPDYLDSLHNPKLELTMNPIDHIEGNSIFTTDGDSTEFDIIILCTGYKIQEYLTPLQIYGMNGRSLENHWKESRGAQAYLGTTVHGFPNFAIIFGPNTFPAHNSVIFTCEVQVEYACKTLIEPIASKRASIIDVKQSAEDADASRMQEGLKGMVWNAGCTNWYLNEYGRNTASYPGFASTFWYECLFPKWSDYELKGGSFVWPFLSIARFFRYSIPRQVYSTILIGALATLFSRKVHFAEIHKLLSLAVSKRLTA